MKQTSLHETHILLSKAQEPFAKHSVFRQSKRNIGINSIGILLNQLVSNLLVEESSSPHSVKSGSSLNSIREEFSFLQVKVGDVCVSVLQSCSSSGFSSTV